MRSAFFPLFVVTCWGLGADVAGRPAAARGDDRASKAEQSILDVAALEAVRNTRGDLAAAELLWQMARKGRLTRPLLKQAAALLDHQDPFVSGVAEWGIAVEIGYENNGVRQAWPPADPLPWYTRWQDVSSQPCAERDYVRQTVARGIHRDPEKLQRKIKRFASL